MPGFIKEEEYVEYKNMFGYLGFFNGESGLNSKFLAICCWNGS